MVRKGSSVRVRQRAFSDALHMPTFSLRLAIRWGEVGPYGNFLEAWFESPGHLSRPLSSSSCRAPTAGPCGDGTTGTTGRSGSKEVFRDRAIPFDLDVVHSRSGDGLDGRRRIGSKPAAGDAGNRERAPRVATAAGCPLAGRGHRSGSSENEHRSEAASGLESPSSAGCIASRRIASTVRCPGRILHSSRRRPAITCTRQDRVVKVHRMRRCDIDHIDIRIGCESLRAGMPIGDAKLVRETVSRSQTLRPHSGHNAGIARLAAAAGRSRTCSRSHRNRESPTAVGCPPCSILPTRIGERLSAPSSRRLQAPVSTCAG
jgi:hypothetical protein